MTRSLRWCVNRLLAMSAAELALRGYRAARYPLEQWAMRSDRYARPSAAMRSHIEQWRGPDPFYFDRALVATSPSSELVAEAEAICAGQRRMLGLGWRAFPRDGWHYEPSANAYWPRVHVARVVRSAPPHFDPRLTWELNRGHEWVLLARVYAATHEPRFLDQLVRELASWRTTNPIGIGINWASAMEAAIRIHSLVWCAGFLRGTTGVLPSLAEAIYEHATVVAHHRSCGSSANNHLIVELGAVIVAALALGGELAKLHGPAVAQLSAELDRQILADGVNAEMATHYHVFVLEALLLVSYLHRAHAMSMPGLEATIRRMAAYLSAIRADDGSLLQQGDDDDGCILGLLRRRPVDQLLAAATALGARSGRGEAEPSGLPLEPRAEGAFWITGGAQRAAVERPSAGSRRFGASGQVVVRSARLHAVFDAGPFGFGRLAAHAHCDALALALAVDGRPILVDRGTYRYSGDRRERDRYRLTAAHNTAQIGALEQAAPAGAFLWSRRPALTMHRCDLSDRGDIVQASHDGFAGWSHRRTLVHHHGVLVILDEFAGAGTPERIVSRYHFAPGLDVITRARAWFHAERDGAPLVCLISNAPQARVIESPHSDEYARRTSAPTVELLGTSDRVLITAIVPADLSQATGLEALARFAATRGIHFSTRELLTLRPLAK